MNNSLERLWVSWLNSERWRQFARSGLVSRMFRSRMYRRIDTTRRFLITSYKSQRQPALFRDVETFCMFIGHVKSGGSLLGSLLDAHPNVILADEADALYYVSAGFRKEQIFYILHKGSQREALKGRVTARRLSPYSFALPGQWQGRYRRLQVIGDSKAGPSTRRLAQNPSLFHQLHQVMAGVDIKFIQVIRNPFDPISAMIVRGKRTYANAIKHYFDYCETLIVLRERLDSSNLIEVKYEDLIRQPKNHLTDLCRFLGIEVSDDYLEACKGILYETPERSRTMVDWSPQWIDFVHKKITQVDFLAGYAYES